MIEEQTEAIEEVPAPTTSKLALDRFPFPWLETALVVAGLLANLLLLPHELGGDGWFRFAALADLLVNGTMPQVKYSMVGPLFSTPFWYLSKIYQSHDWWLSRYNVFVLGAGMLAIYWLLKDRVNRGLLRKFFLLLVMASMFPYHLLYYYGEAFTAVFVAVGCVALVAGPALVGWCVIILGVVNTPATLLGLFLLDGMHILAKRRVRYVLALFAALALMMLESWIRRGSPFANGYADDHGVRTIMPYSGRPGFSNPFFFGLISLLFSFGKGIFFFAPGLLLPIRQTLRAVREKMSVDLFAIYLLWISFFIGVLLVYSSWWAWHGGWFWGPRFLLIASVPASFALAVRLQWLHRSLFVNVLTLLVLVLSVWVGINGAVYGDKALMSFCLANNAYLETPVCYYTPEFSVLWHPFVVYQPLDHKQLLYLLYSLFVGVYLLVPLANTTGRQAFAAALGFVREFRSSQRSLTW
ncbi:MAG: hypothetical protein M3Z08_18750 [Chloroflexota bacterium]|nr:hypothetical protein [Chloroflexota bacterium]